MLKKTLLSLTLLSTLTQAEMVRINSKDMVLDTDTKLIWQDDAITKNFYASWQGAIDYCEKLSLEGYDDWVLPDLKALQALYPKKGSLQNVDVNYYWTSTPNSSDLSSAWGVNFFFGYESSFTKKHYNYVRCVRDGYTLFFNSLPLFLNAIGMTDIEKTKITFFSSNVDSKEFYFRNKGQEYFGNKKYIFARLAPAYSSSPFGDTQKLTQKNLNVQKTEQIGHKCRFSSDTCAVSNRTVMPEMIRTL